MWSSHGVGTRRDVARKEGPRLRCGSSSSTRQTPFHTTISGLFDLCQTLDLQLLIAAPEVPSEGNTPIISCGAPARRTEEVLAAGRRTKGDA